MSGWDYLVLALGASGCCWRVHTASTESPPVTTRTLGEAIRACRGAGWSLVHAHGQSYVFVRPRAWWASEALQFEPMRSGGVAGQG